MGSAICFNSLRNPPPQTDALCVASVENPLECINGDVLSWYTGISEDRARELPETPRNTPGRRRDGVRYFFAVQVETPSSGLRLLVPFHSRIPLQCPPGPHQPVNSWASSGEETKERWLSCLRPTGIG